MKKSLYRMYNKDGVLLYVGMSCNPSSRLTSHSARSLWFSDVVKITITRLESSELCREAEAEAIYNESPLFNKSRPASFVAKKRSARKVIESDSALVDVWIIIDDGGIRPARGHIRGDMVMVPSAHGPLYFSRPRWHESKESAAAHLKAKAKKLRRVA